MRVSTLPLGRILERLWPLSIGRRLNRAAATNGEVRSHPEHGPIFLPLSFSTLTDIVLKRLSMNIEVRAREYQNPRQGIGAASDTEMNRRCYCTTVGNIAVSKGRVKTDFVQASPPSIETIAIK